MSDKIINEPLISISTNAYYEKAYNMIILPEQIQSRAAMVRFDIIENKGISPIHRLFYRAAASNDMEYSLSEDLAAFSSVRAFEAVAATKKGRPLLENMTPEEAIKPAADFCRLTTSSGNYLYIPAQFEPLKTALVAGLSGAHVEIEVDTENFTSQIKVYSGLAKPSKKPNSFALSAVS